MTSLIYYLHILIVTVSFSYVPPAFATVTQILCKTNIRKSRKKCLNCFSRIPSFWIRNIPILNSLPWLTPHLTRFRTVLFCNRCFRSLSFGLIICGIRPKKNTGYSAVGYPANLISGVTLEYIATFCRPETVFLVLVHAF